jgi:hypothetical protein
MSEKHQSGQRLLCAAGITLALLGLVSQSATAQEAVQSNDALTVVRDPGTGKLRHATAEEQVTIQAQAQSQVTGRVRALRAAPQVFQQKYHASGARGVRLTDEFTSSAVAVRKPDGSVDMQCFDSHDAAHTVVTAGHVHTNKVETE